MTFFDDVNKVVSDAIDDVKDGIKDIANDVIDNTKTTISNSIASPLYQQILKGKKFQNAGEIKSFIENEISATGIFKTVMDKIITPVAKGIFDVIKGSDSSSDNSSSDSSDIIDLPDLPENLKKYTRTFPDIKDMITNPTQFLKDVVDYLIQTPDEIQNWEDMMNMFGFNIITGQIGIPFPFTIPFYISNKMKKLYQNGVDPAKWVLGFVIGLVLLIAMIVMLIVAIWKLGLINKIRGMI